MMNLKSRALILFLCLVFAVCVAIGVIHVKTERFPPKAGLDAPEVLRREDVLHLRVSGGSEPCDANGVKIYAVQGKTRERITPRYSGTYNAGTFTEDGTSNYPGVLTLGVSLSETKAIRDGELRLEVQTRGSRNKNLLGGLLAPFWTVEFFPLKADFTPPGAKHRLYSTALVRGGAALFCIEADEPPDFITLSGGQTQYALQRLASGRYAALLAFPQDAPLDEYRLALRMKDKAGNIGGAEIFVPGEEFQFRHDSIRLNDKFFKAKEREFREYTGRKNASPVELFLTMNREVREYSYRRLAELCRNGKTEKLWNGPFMEMPSAVRRSEFADRRDYIYNDELIDRQVHLGLDYASIAKDRVPAANDGEVRFTGYLGIHGNAVLIDHGLGLYSLYSHLSEIEARVGQNVSKGDFIGRTGATGMAGGDHLHFEILVNGISVNPDFWFDPAWLEKNIEAPLAGLAGEAHE